MISINKIAGVFLASALIFVGVKFDYASVKVTRIDGYGKVAISRDGRIIGAAKYDNIYAPLYSDMGKVSEGMLAVCKNKKWGYVDTNDKLIINYKYDQVEDFNDGVALVKQNNKYGLIDKSGNAVTKIQYDDRIYNTLKSANQLYGLSINNKWGFVDKKGMIAVPFKYESVKEFNNGLAAFEENGKWGFVDVKGDIVIKPQYEEAGILLGTNTKNNSRTSVYLNYIKKDNLYGIVNNFGEIVTEPSISFTNIYNASNPINFSEGYCPVDIDSKIGFIDLSGKVAIKPQYDVNFNDATAYAFSEGLCAIMKDRMWGYINSFGKMVIPAVYTNAERFSHGMAMVTKDNVWEFINKDGKKAFDAKKYSSVMGSFGDDGLLCVGVKDIFHYGYVNTKGEMVIQPKYSNAGVFLDGVAEVTDNSSNKRELIDTKGKVLFTADTMGERGQYAFSKAYDGLIDFSINNHHGLLNNEGQIIVKPQYDYIDPICYNGILHVTQNNLSGYIDEKGKELFSPMFTNYDYFSDNNDNGKYAYPQLQIGCFVASSANGETSGKFYSDASDEAEGMTAVKQGSYWGYLDDNGKLKIPFQYESADKFSEGRALVCVNGLYGYIDAKGKMVIKPQFRTPGHCNGSLNIPPQGFSEGLALVCDGGSYGYIDKNGKFIIDCKYDLATSFSEGLACVEDNGCIAYINKKGEEVIKLNCDFYDNFFDFNGPTNLTFKNGRAIVLPKAKYGFRDSDGKEIIKAQYDDVFNFSEGLAAVKQGSLWGYVDGKGNMVIKPQFTAAASFSDGLAKVSNSESKYGFIDKTGKLVIDYKYNGASNFKEGYAKVSASASDGSVTFIDKNGKSITTLDIKSYGMSNGVNTGDFSEGLAAVQVGDYAKGQRGYIDSSGKMTITEKGMSELGDFSDGVASFNSNGFYGYINKSGAVAIKPVYNQVTQFNEGYAAVCIDKQWGVIDKTGKYIVKPKYDRILEFKDGLAIVSIGYKWGAIDEKGKEILPVNYDYIGSYNNGFFQVEYYDKSLKTNVRAFVNSNGKEQIWLNGKDYSVKTNFKGNVANVLLSSSDRAFSQSNQSVYIDKNGKTISEPDYYDYDNPYEKSQNINVKDEGIYPICVYGKYIYIDKKGNYAGDVPKPKISK